MPSNAVLEITVDEIAVPPIIAPPQAIERPEKTVYVIVEFPPPATPSDVCTCEDPNCTNRVRYRTHNKNLSAPGVVRIHVPGGGIPRIPISLAQAMANGAAVHGVQDVGLLIDDRLRFARRPHFPIVMVPRLTTSKFVSRSVAVRGDLVETTALYFNSTADLVRDRVYPDVVVLDRDRSAIEPFALVGSTGQFLQFTTDIAGLGILPATLIETAVAWYVKDFDYDALRYAEFVESRRVAIEQWIDSLQQRIRSNEEDIARWNRSIETTARAIHETVVLIEGVSARVEKVDPKTEWDSIAGLVAAGVIRSYELVWAERNDSPYLKIETPIIDVGGLGTLKTAYEIRIMFGDQGENSILITIPESAEGIDIGRGYYHPHVTQRGTICWGGYAAEIVGLHHAGRYAELIARICAFLVDYNPPDAYQRLRKAAADKVAAPATARRRQCVNCGTPTQTGCERCGDPYCGCHHDTDCPACRNDIDNDNEDDGDDGDDNDDDTTVCTNCNLRFGVPILMGAHGDLYCSEPCRAAHEPNSRRCPHVVLDVPCNVWTDNRCRYPSLGDLSCPVVTCGAHPFCPGHTALICRGCGTTVGTHEVRVEPDRAFCSERCLRDNGLPQPQEPE